MQLEQLKTQILDGSLRENFFIFKIEDNDFLANQYIKAISKNKDLLYIKDLSDLLKSKDGLLNTQNDYFSIYRCSSFNIIDNYFHSASNLIIVASSVSKEAESEYYYNVVKFPKLEEWHIKEYAYTLGEGISKEELDLFVEDANFNIFRIDNELSKLKYFSPSQRKYLFGQMALEGSFRDISNYSIFSLTKSIQAKDIEAIKKILIKEDSIDIDPISIMSILYQNFRNMILVWLDKNPTPETTGLKSNQIWAIKNIPHNYNKEKLIKILKFLTSLDYKLKSGELPNKNLFSYILVSVLNA
jgi:DNA polymerase III delta subunit